MGSWSSGTPSGLPSPAGATLSISSLQQLCEVTVWRSGRYNDGPCSAGAGGTAGAVLRERPKSTEPEATDPDPRTPREPKQVVRLRDPLVASGIAGISVGALLLGSAAVGLGLGAHAEAEGEWLLSSRPDLASDSPEAARLSTVGRQANLLALIGGAVGAVALSSGIALYMVGKRRQATSAPTLSFPPSLTPQRLGGGVRIRF